MEMTIHRPGQLTTVQDIGRRGFRSDGVPLSGAMDPFALRIANLLVGNSGNEACLEITFIGPEVSFSEDALVSLCGAQFESAQSWRPWLVHAGVRVDLGECRHGSRAYLAVSGGMATEPVMGSRSTFLRAGLGGLQGRALRAGDRIAIGKAPPNPRNQPPGFSVSRSLLPAYSPSPTVRMIAGAQAGEFPANSLTQEFTVTPRSDRMGLRLSGPKLVRSRSDNLLSTAVTMGTIQVPQDGQPIVLMADAQTLGGYPLAGHVATVDLPLVAQLRPGERLRFSDIGLDDAQRLLTEQESNLVKLRDAIAQKLKDWRQ